ncbi:MAG: SDR family oxidoreductase [Phycisphaeraceae bacterium]
MSHHCPQRIFLTGATGYIGGRLAPRLLDAGHQVTCLVRDARKLVERPWSHHANLRIIEGNVVHTDWLAEQMAGHDTAYYLVHSMVATGGKYAEHDRKLAESFTRASEMAQLKRIIYLGGLGELGTGLSQHLRSRREVEDILAAGAVPLTSFRAAMIIGSGSASFEILRYLVDRLPVMITPRWVRTESQPIGIADTLHYLVRCLDVPETTGQTLEIGGPTVHTYIDLMQIMAKELGLMRRIILPVPVLTPRLSSLWIGLVTPVSSRLARPLAEGLRNRVVVTNNLANELMPHEPLTAEEAIRRAVRKTTLADVETRWSAAGVIPGDPDWAGGSTLVDRREIEITAGPTEVFTAVCRVGGGHGYYAADILWKIRGWMDQLVGGPGLRRGRRHPENVEYGETLDFWRVIDVQRNKRLALFAEMKLPGEAGLEFTLDPISETTTRLTMTARFRPRGLPGLIYWYAVLPLHHIVFSGMLYGMKRAAEELSSQPLQPKTSSS